MAGSDWPSLPRVVPGSLVIIVFHVFHGADRQDPDRLIVD